MASLRQRHINVNADSQEKNEDNLPVFTPPSFTIKELLSAIPAHCFERSAIRSFSYVFQDVTIAAALVYAASYIDDNLSGPLNFLAWAAYSFAQGMICTGIWIIAHECGHQAFSTSKALNNAVGWVLHSALLVPYHSWRISHGKHHAATGHMDRDQVFVPKTRSRRGIAPDTPSADTPAHFKKMDEVLEDAPLYVLSNLLLQLLFGWPMYLFTNASSCVTTKRTNHFEPSSSIFDARHRTQILWSDFGLLLTVSALYYLGQTFGSWTIVKYYVFPYLWVNNWLVLITYLQHTDPILPHYRDGEWNFQRGALATVDRNFMGPIGSFCWHGITETHTAHHLSSKIPHYNAWEATEALKPVLGEYYIYSDKNMLVAAYESYKNCRFVEDEGKCIFYKDSHGKSTRRVVYADGVSDSGVEVQ